MSDWSVFKFLTGEVTPGTVRGRCAVCYQRIIERLWKEQPNPVNVYTLSSAESKETDCIRLSWECGSCGCGSLLCQSCWNELKGEIDTMFEKVK